MTEASWRGLSMTPQWDSETRILSRGKTNYNQDVHSTSIKQISLWDKYSINNM